MRFGLTITPRGRRLLRAALGLVVVAGVLGGGWLWFRDSSLVQVRDVEIDGVTASDGDQVRAALDQAALNMSTLHVDVGALKQAAEGYSSVAGVTAKADFPRKLTIHVIEQQPVAAIAAPGQRVPVTGAGVVLRGVVADKDLPSINANLPAGRALSDRATLRALEVAAKAPPQLLYRSTHLSTDNQGVVVWLRSGPQLVFGTAAHASAKWTAAARVLAEPSAQGATYLDLRIPGRVAAGGLAPIPQATADPNLQPEAQASPTVNP